MVGTAALERAEARVRRACGQGYDSLTLLHLLAEDVQVVVPYDACFWSTVDPATLLFTGGFGTGMSPEVMRPVFDNELTEPDYNKFTDLARRRPPVGILSEATGGKLALSRRHLTVHRPRGFAWELRAAFTDGAACWGIVGFSRKREAPDFTPAEAAWIGGLAPVIAAGLRMAVLLEAANGRVGPEVPGLLILDHNGAIESSNTEAREWLSELDSGSAMETGLPIAVYQAATRARDLDGGQLPTARVKTRSGEWAVVHASLLSGSSPRTAVIIERARPPELAPLIAQAYGLTDRERQLLPALVRGLKTTEIAAELFISPHTVRDHVKAIFDKVGVGTRGELVARIFYSHYLPAAAGPGARTLPELTRT